MMSYEDLYELGFVEDEAVVLDPREIFNKAVVVVSVDGRHLIYDYELAAEALQNANSEGDAFDLQEAIEYLEFNTLRALEYVPTEFRPIVVHM